MAENREPSEEVINEAILRSLEFEEIVEKIDFNSYLLPSIEKQEVKDSHSYKIYESRINQATEKIERVLKNHTNEIIGALFEAKLLRLEARKQDRKEEKDKLKDALFKLNIAFSTIEPKNFKGDLEKEIENGFSRTGLYAKKNWAKMLLYNEMAICYSGLAESSISLGFATRATALLKKLISNEEANTNLLSSYTFALYNKGIAENLLGDYEQSLKTFGKIFKIFSDNKKLLKERPSDYYSSSIQVARILIEYARGQEALEYLENVKIPDTFDYRIQEYKLEKANAYVDMKKYGKAFNILEKCSKKANKTFVRRKALVNELKLVLEFIDNQSKDFNDKNVNNDINEKIREKYRLFERFSEELLIECIDRHDLDVFKKACDRLADYFHNATEKSKDLKERQENEERELKSYYLYLYNERISEEAQNGKLARELIAPWISKEVKTLKDFINSDDIDYKKKIEKTDDEHYLKNFYETYIDFYKESNDHCPESADNVITDLYERLARLFHERDDLTEEGKIIEKYNIHQNLKKKYQNDSNQIKNEKKDPEHKRTSSIEFIGDYFFKKPFTNTENKYLRPQSMLDRMEKNTTVFADKVVSTTNRFSQDQEFRAIFCVLRRWNSFTPALTSSINPSKGGGYFLYLTNNGKSLGIAIDPGYNFLENFLSSGFKIGDIDTVLISHAHPDHTDDMPKLISLFHEANDKLGKYHFNGDFNKRHRRLILSQGVYDQYYKGFIKPIQKALKDVIVLKPGKSISLSLDKKHPIIIKAFPTYHGDLARGESLGFVFHIIDGESVIKVGYTGDAHWKEGLSEELKDCSIVCAHLGSVVNILSKEEFCNLCDYYKIDAATNKCQKLLTCQKENFKNVKPTIEKLEKQAITQKHLYLSGLTMLFDDLLKNKKINLAVMSEFGEELKGDIRLDLFHKFDDWFAYKTNGQARCFPGDIGLEIDVMNGNIFCSCCQKFRPKTQISPVSHGGEEALFFVCDECKQELSSYEIWNKLNDCYENGRKLETTE